jgi:hypothetical protein
VKNFSTSAKLLPSSRLLPLYDYAVGAPSTPQKNTATAATTTTTTQQQQQHTQNNNNTQPHTKNQKNTKKQTDVVDA